MLVQSVLNMLFGVENVYHSIDLIGISACKRYDFIVLRHFVKEMLSIWPEHIAFRFARAMAKNLDDIDD